MMALVGNGYLNHNKGDTGTQVGVNGQQADRKHGDIA